MGPHRTTEKSVINFGWLYVVTVYAVYRAVVRPWVERLNYEAIRDTLEDGLTDWTAAALAEKHACSVATVYLVLRQLEDQGLVESHWRPGAYSRTRVYRGVSHD